VGQTSTPTQIEQTSSFDQAPASPAQALAVGTTKSTPAIPDWTWVQVSITDWGPLQKAATGATVPLVVTEDVTVNGVTAIAAGTRLTGVISKQKRGTQWLGPDGRMQIQAGDLRTPDPILIYRRSVLDALRGPKPTPDPRDSHALKVLAISTGAGLVLGLLGNDQQTGSRAADGAIGAGVGLVIGTIIEASPPPTVPIWGFPR
jgi:hypothetical protein